MDRKQWEAGMGSRRFEEESSKWWQMESPLSYAIALLCLLLIISAAWYMFSGNKTININTLPIVEADPTPVKTMPENVGRVDVPHQDKLFYNQVSPKDNKPVVERLLPPPEEPIQLGETQSIQEQPAPMVAQTQAPEPNRIVEKPTDNTEQSINLEDVAPPIDDVKKQEVVSQNKVDPAPIVKNEVVTKKSVAPPKKPAIVEKYRVQVAALPSSEGAKKEWTRLTRSMPTLLKSQKVHYERVDLGAKKGIFYRIQIGEFNEKGAAQTFCKRLAAQKVACKVVPYKK